MSCIGPALLALLALALSACASTTPAPITYGHTSPLLTSVTPTPRPALPPPRPSAPPTLPYADLATPPFDTIEAPVVLADQPYSECVPYARGASGVAIYGDAVTWWAQADGRYPRSSHPAEGSVLVLRGWNDDTRGHVAVVRAILSSRMIEVDHANWLGTGEVSLNVPVIDVSEANDWSEVRVWNIPDNHWGGRVYDAQGFIHSFAFPATPPLVG